MTSTTPPASDQNVTEMSSSTLADQLLTIEERLADELLKIQFNAPVEYVYNPIDHAKELHTNFLNRYYSSGDRSIMFLGMNPGPWGMIQTGVPFGEVSVVKDFLKISGNVTPPVKEHPKRKVEGLNCKRNEVSGQRFWNFFKKTCVLPENFTNQCLVYNLCPLSFMTESGKNVPLNEIKIEARNQLLKVCEESLVDVLNLFNVKQIICLGRFVESQTKKIIKNHHLEVRVDFLVHPSPASPIANAGWHDIARTTLEKLGVYKELVCDKL